MLICCFDIGVIIHFESVREGTTVAQTLYTHLEVLYRLIAVRRKRGELILHHDNASGNSSLRLPQFSARKDISAVLS
jgi:hypothetical protein